MGLKTECATNTDNNKMLFISQHSKNSTIQLSVHSYSSH